MWLRWLFQRWLQRISPHNHPCDNEQSVSYMYQLYNPIIQSILGEPPRFFLKWSSRAVMLKAELWLVSFKTSDSLAHATSSYTFLIFCDVTGNSFVILGVHAVTVVGSWVCLSVSQSVCLLPRFLPPRTINHKSTAFARYGVKSKWTSQYAYQHRLTSTGSACSVYLGGTQKLTMNGVYRLPHAIYYCS